MLEWLLKRKEYPIWLLLGAPENILDLFSFVLFFGYMLIKANGLLPLWFDLTVALIHFFIFIIFKNHKYKNSEFTNSIKHTLSFLVFFILWYVIEIFF